MMTTFVMKQTTLIKETNEQFKQMRRSLTPPLGNANVHSVAKIEIVVIPPSDEESRFSNHETSTDDGSIIFTIHITFIHNNDTARQRHLLMPPNLDVEPVVPITYDYSNMYQYPYGLESLDRPRNSYQFDDDFQLTEEEREQEKSDAEMYEQIMAEAMFMAF